MEENATFWRSKVSPSPNQNDPCVAFCRSVQNPDRQHRSPPWICLEVQVLPIAFCSCEPLATGPNCLLLCPPCLRKSN
jgi:hypothetical protein